MSPRSAAPLLLLATLAVGPRAARAHEFRPAVLTISAAADGAVEVTLQVPRDSPARAVAGLRPLLPAPCVLGPARAAGTRQVWRGTCGPQGPRGPLAVAGLVAGAGDVVVEVRRADGAREVGVLRPGAAGMQLGARAELDARGYLDLGVAHILAGADHLLFVAGLVVLTLRAGGSRRRRALGLLGTLTAFTAAHSVTLGAATLGLLRVPQAPVEACIALSIVLLARALVLPPRGGPPWGLAFGCGLLHGLGFAGALAEVGLPADGVVAALLAFNVGVELGQAGVAAGLAAALTGVAAALGGAGRAPRWLALGTGYGLGAVATAWTIARVVAL